MHSYTFLLLLPLSHCVTVRYHRQDIISKSKVEMLPMFITCSLNDIVIVAAPVVNTASLYHLYKPNGDFIQLNLPRNKTMAKHTTNDGEDMVVKYINSETKTIYPVRNSRVIGTRNGESSEDVVNNAELDMSGNEFMIGPLLEEDHGNWMLSIYFKDSDDEWIEMYQVITIEIVEKVPLVPAQLRLRPGSKLHLKFAYPIQHLKSCELTAPSSSYDRFFDRSKIDLERCGYIVPNVTKNDEGTWRIIGIGNMMFEGYLNLQIV